MSLISRDIASVFIAKYYDISYQTSTVGTDLDDPEIQFCLGENHTSERDRHINTAFMNRVMHKGQKVGVECILASEEGSVKISEQSAKVSKAVTAIGWDTVGDSAESQTLILSKSDELRKSISQLQSITAKISKIEAEMDASNTILKEIAEDLMSKSPKHNPLENIRMIEVFSQELAVNETSYTKLIEQHNTIAKAISTLQSEIQALKVESVVTRVFSAKSDTLTSKFIQQTWLERQSSLMNTLIHHPEMRCLVAGKDHLRLKSIGPIRATINNHIFSQLGHRGQKVVMLMPKEKKSKVKVTTKS